MEPADNMLSKSLASDGIRPAQPLQGLPSISTSSTHPDPGSANTEEVESKNTKELRGDADRTSHQIHPYIMSLPAESVNLVDVSDSKLCTRTTADMSLVGNTTSLQRLEDRGFESVVPIVSESAEEFYLLTTPVSEKSQIAETIKCKIQCDRNVIRVETKGVNKSDFGPVLCDKTNFIGHARVTNDKENNASTIEYKDSHVLTTVAMPISNVDIPSWDYLQLLLNGIEVPGDTNVSLDTRPEWLDMELFRRGQRFATKYLFGLVYAEMLSLMMLFSFPDSLQPLIYSGNSDTPFKAFKRYLSTVTRVKSWYEGDLWKKGEEACRNLKVVRTLHSGFRNRLNAAERHELSSKLTLSPGPTWSNLCEEIQQDFISSCSGQCPLQYRGGRLFINQTDMALTQFGFIGLVVLHPASFGAARASEDDLAGFVHLWRTIGYMLGINDKYNFCAGDLATVRQRCRDVIQCWVRPSWRSIGRDWEHMLRCVVEGINYYIPMLYFEVCLIYLCRLLEMDMPRLTSALTIWHRFTYGVMAFVMRWLLRMPWYLAFSNWLLKMAIKRAQNASPRWLQDHETRIYPYQRNQVCTRL